MLAATAAGCSLLPGGGDDGAGGGDPITGLLAAVPDTPDNRHQLTVTDHAGLAHAVDTTWPPGDGTDGNPSADAVDAFLSALFESGEVVPPSELNTLFQGQDDWREQFGFSAADVNAAARAGVPPSEITVFRTTAEASAIAQAVTSDPSWSADLQTAERDGATIYTWGDDPLQARTDQTSRARPLGQGGALAVAGDGLVVRGADPATVNAAADVQAGTADSLGGDADFAGMARALDGQGCYQAFFSDQVPVLNVAKLAGPRANPAQLRQLEAQLADGPALPPYRAIGIGQAVDDQGRGYVVFAFATGSGDEAKAVIDAFPQVVAEGTSAATGQAWSELLTVRSTAADGSVAVVTVDTEHLSIGTDAFVQYDTLLATR